jgi:hypothetical protein
MASATRLYCVQKAIWLVLAGLSVALVASCGGPASVVGKYKAKVESPAGQSKDNPGQALGEGLANALASSMTLELKADHTFSMTMIFPIEGTWSMSGSDVTLSPQSVMGMKPDEGKSKSNEPMVFAASADGKTLTAKAEKPGEGKLTFVRE